MFKAACNSKFGSRPVGSYFAGHDRKNGLFRKTDFYADDTDFEGLLTKGAGFVCLKDLEETETNPVCSQKGEGTLFPNG